MKLQESAEMYLETILILSKHKAEVRSIDIVSELDYRKSSVSVAMKNLREEGFIEMDSSGYIILTPKGREIAETMYERHTLITNWLVSIGVDKDIAAADACRMEHVISHESFEAMKKHIQSNNL